MRISLLVSALALALPDWSVTLMWIMAAGVAVSVAQRAHWALRALRMP